MNNLIIKGLEVFAYHGVHDFEKKEGQIFIIDIILDIPQLQGFETDEIDDVINYSQVIKVIKNSFSGQKYNLIEKTAYTVLESLFKTFKQINSADITIKKPNAPIKDKVEYVAFRVLKKRSDYNV